jgi:hypothetical protein
MSGYTKLQVAGTQLQTAVRLLFEDSEPFSVETLCGAVLGVLHALAERHNIKGLLNNPELIRPEVKETWHKKLHEVPNFLKHADKDWDAIIDYNPEVLPYKLFEATALYDKLTNVLEHATKSERFVAVYQFWFGITHPNLVKKEETQWTGLLKKRAEKLPSNAGKDFFLSLLLERKPQM